MAPPFSVRFHSEASAHAQTRSRWCAVTGVVRRRVLVVRRFRNNNHHDDAHDVDDQRNHDAFEFGGNITRCEAADTRSRPGSGTGPCAGQADACRADPAARR